VPAVSLIDHWVQVVSPCYHSTSSPMLGQPVVSSEKSPSFTAAADAKAA
jgi:hypothetical protein